MQHLFEVVFGVLGLRGLRDNRQVAGNNALLDGLIRMALDVRAAAKANKDFATSDKIRDELGKLGVVVKNTKEGTTWAI